MPPPVCSPYSRLVMAPINPHQKQFEQDLEAGVAQYMRENPGMTPKDAVERVTSSMLANNPFVPPQGCPINDLPNELLAHIFYLGMKMQEEYEQDGDLDEDDGFQDGIDLTEGWSSESDDEDLKMGSPQKGKGKRKQSEEPTETDEEDKEDEEDRPELPFQVLVSHVCRWWREAAIEEPSLWTTLGFSYGTPIEKSKAWIERSKGLPLDIVIDCTTPDDWEGTEGDQDEDEDDVMYDVQDSGSAQVVAFDAPDFVHAPPCLSTDDLGPIFDLLLPHVGRWRLLEVSVSEYESIYTVMKRLAVCAGAPILEALQLYHYEDCEDYDVFRPTEFREPLLLFQGNIPKLKDLALWGVHIDWVASLSFLKDLRDVELAYHANDVRPSMETFACFVHASPELHTLSLCLSGPAGPSEQRGTDLISIPSLHDLVLAHHEPEYIQSLLPILFVPNVQHLALDFDSADYTEFVKVLLRPQAGQKKSLLEGLEHLKIGGLPCDRQCQAALLLQLGNLRSINLNAFGEEEEQFFDALLDSAYGTKESGQKVLCPNLHTVTTTGISGKKMRSFVEARKRADAPISKVLMSERDDVEEKDKKWLSSHLEEFEFFEPSDSEEELDPLLEIGDDEIDIDD
ncbi:uncharacterized protein BT62DRAFT_347562 [Guyanagaster necrorhizus]|uniref:F-box domain-containing protein n=1 Tax=Guyanagaster necrorhizus TaxID=856835 RepID=A0A9P8APK1_9AGAR|nr:uncharacterized protein BT62DRAFT_347562 [Guyanagaster necrorhizus MCA 3950]KAG7443059.1 hypothetical protein BT62DRAFT_347562 [Guyanagaster necrorhizus MCA 3950]